MIEYLHKASSNSPIGVRLDGKIVGEIRKVDGGFQYFPKCQKTGGATYESLALVQQSFGG